MRLTLSLNGSSYWEIILRPCARRNRAIREYSPLNRFPGLENSNTHCFSFIGVIELSTSPSGKSKSSTLSVTSWYDLFFWHNAPQRVLRILLATRPIIPLLFLRHLKRKFTYSPNITSLGIIVSFS